METIGSRPWILFIWEFRLSRQFLITFRSISSLYFQNAMYYNQILPAPGTEGRMSPQWSWLA